MMLIIMATPDVVTGLYCKFNVSAIVARKCNQISGCFDTDSIKYPIFENVTDDNPNPKFSHPADKHVFRVTLNDNT